VTAGLARLRAEVFDGGLVSHGPGVLDALDLVEGLRAGGNEEPMILLGSQPAQEIDALCYEVGADEYCCVAETTVRGLLWKFARAIERGQLVRENRRLVQSERQRLQQEHLEADVPTALFLSGGVDSSVLAVLMDKIDCFHLRSDETEMARYVAEQVGSELQVCDPAENVDYEKTLEDYARNSGDVSASSPIPYLVAQQIRKAGYPVAFSANGGDELFHGYSRTPSPELNDTFMPNNGYETQSYSCLAKQARNVFRSPENFFLPNAPQTSQSFIELTENIENRFLLPNFPKSASHRWLELQTYVLEDLNPTLDYASMVHSVEVRVPFLDHRIVEAALTLDANTHITAEYGRKSPLKAMLDQHKIHPFIWARPKMGFSLNSEVIANLHHKKLQALAELSKEGYLQIDARIGEVCRDFAYLGSAALAFSAWKKVWIDTGIVKA
ncbi:MAG: asparagine synthase C-terminal domain-containing protein, partial [Verrucomicrobiales bacterium]|nr:asparagine synthase C-terminal domain-containing protein [Verrucomicrobiales bacterium]